MDARHSTATIKRSSAKHRNSRKIGCKSMAALQLQRLETDLTVTQVAFCKRGIRRATRVDLLHNGSFFEAIAPVLVMAQCFCLMPVCGIRGKSTRQLHFQWASFRTCYCVLYIAAAVTSTLLTAHMLIHDELDARNLEPLVFHTFLLLAAVLFLRLAAKWPELMRKWALVEQQMPPFEDWRQREHLSQRIKIVTFVFITLSLTEHLLSTISAIHFANYCPSRADPIESYFASVDSQFFYVFEFSMWLAWLGKLQNVLMTFGWSYMDVFLMIIGIGLSELLGRLHRSMTRVQGQSMPESYWTNTRLMYRRISELIAAVDDAVSAITMLSFANNLYFVCIQCLKSINKMPSAAHAVYFYFSLGYLLSRTLAVSLFLAEVNDRASSEPLLILKHVPKESYCAEVERFANEIAQDMVALTGLNFFNVTRKLVLTMAGTIVTYELVLIQFHEDQNLWHCGTD